MPRDVLPWGGEFSAARAPSGEATLRAPGLGTGPPFPRLLSFLTLSCRQRLREPGSQAGERPACGWVPAGARVGGWTRRFRLCASQAPLRHGW